MHIILILLFINNILPDETNAKYIDLLPEHEKQEFLNKIARRIFEEVQSSDGIHKPSSEVSDDQLNRHDEYVRKILEEERKNLRKHNVDDPNISVIPIDKSIGEDRHIDLTIRSDKDNDTKVVLPVRRVLSGLETDVNVAIKLDERADAINYSETDEDIQAKPYRRARNIVNESNDNKSAPRDNFSANIVNVTETANNDATSSVPDIVVHTESATQDFDELPITEESTISPNKFISTLQEKETTFLTESNLADNTYINESPITNRISTTSVTSDILTSTHLETYATEPLPNYLNSRISKSFEENGDNITDRNSNKTDSDITRIEVMTLEGPSTKSNFVIDSAIEYVTTEIETSTTETHLRFTDNSVNNETETESNKNVLMKELPPALLNANDLAIDKNITSRGQNNDVNLEKNIVSIESFDMKRKVDKTAGKNEVRTRDSGNVGVKSTEKIADDMITALRQHFLEDTIDKSIEKSGAPLYESAENVYLVYEIPANQSPFVINDKLYKVHHEKTSEKGIKKIKEEEKVNEETGDENLSETGIEDQPFYVPVYIYSPDKAFYNPHNRLGPNESDKENDDTTKISDELKPIEWDYLYSEDFRGSDMDNEEIVKHNSMTNMNIKVLAPQYSLKDESYEDSSDDDNINSEFSRSHCDETDIDEKGFLRCIKMNPRIAELSEVVKTEDSSERLMKKMNYQSGLRNVRQYLLEKKLLKITPASYNTHKPIVYKPDDLDKNNNKKKTNDRDNGKKKKKEHKSPASSLNKDDDDDDDDRSKGRKKNKYPIDTWLRGENSDDGDNKIKKKVQRPTSTGKKDHDGEDDVGKKNKYPSADENDDDVDKANDESKKHKRPVQRWKGQKSKKYRPNIFLLRTDFDSIGINKSKIIFIAPRNKRSKIKKAIATNICNDGDKECSKWREEKIQKARKFHHQHRSLLQHYPKKIEPKPKPDYNLMMQVTNIVDSKDILPVILKLQEMTFKRAIKRKSETSHLKEGAIDVNVYVGIMNDMMESNNAALVQFDWLGTAVDLQSAIKKINDLISAIRYSEEMHPTDSELLKYLIYLYNSAEEQLSIERTALQAKESGNSLRSFLPQNRRKKKKYITDKGLISSKILLMRKIQEMTIEKDELKAFQAFVEDLESSLRDLHTAIRYLSMVTKYNENSWFQNLKILEDFGRKKSLVLLIHILSTRVLDLIAKSASRGMEFDYLDYMMNNMDDVITTQKEIEIILKLLEELKKLN